MHTNVMQLYSLSKSALEQNEIKKSIDACRELNSQFPDFFEGWWLAGCIHLRLQKPEAGLISTSRALELKHNHPLILIQRVEFLSLLERHGEVKQTLETLADDQSGDPDIHTNIAMLLSAEEMHRAAIRHYLVAVQLRPKDAQLYYNLAAAYRFTGDSQKCEASLNKCLSINYLDAEAQSMRSSLRTQSESDNHIDELIRAHTDRAISESDKSGMCYALSKEFDDLDNIEKSFSYLKKGSDIRRASMSYDVKTDETIMEAIKNHFDSATCRKTISVRPGIQPIFIIGLPRSGTTLLERILDSHSSILSRGELDIFGVEMAKEASIHTNKSNPSILDLISQSKNIDLDSLADRYLSKAAPANNSGSYFIDKLPLNFLYVGLIHRALPEAKIINLTRHPLASCMAMYRQQFRDIYPFSYDLTDLGHYFVAYHRLMSHWNSVLPGVIHSVSYENLVINTEKETKRVLKFCDLTWEPRCLRFYENEAPSTTASATQVRQPVYNRSINQWRKYTHHLDDLSAIIAKAGIDVE